MYSRNLFIVFPTPLYIKMFQNPINSLCNAFSGMVSCSGSLWYEGVLDYVQKKTEVVLIFINMTLSIVYCHCYQIIFH